MVMTVLFAGNLKPDVFPTSGRIKRYKKRASLRAQSNEMRSSLDMSRQVARNFFS